MAECVIQKSGGGADLDVITARAEDVLEGKVTIDKDGDPVTGTMIDRGDWSSSELAAGASLTIPGGKHRGGGKVAAKSLASQTQATAIAARIYSGETAYVNGVKLTGTMTCNSIINFSAATYSTSQILLKWQNPYVASGKGYTGVRIMYSTSGYPGTGGTQIYQGYGDNKTPGGWSSVIVNMPAAGTTYYFSARSYTTFASNGVWFADAWGAIFNASAATTKHGRVVLTGSGTFTVPAGVRVINAHGAGGGGRGGSKFTVGTYVGAGGGGGYSKWINGIGVTPGEGLPYVIGDGMPAGNEYGQGGQTRLLRGSTVLLSADGGWGGNNVSSTTLSSGGSGGGGARKRNASGERPGGNGGSDGSDGYSDAYWFYPGIGQHSTTREFGTGTLFSGGGGGSGGAASYPTGSGGAGGGGSSAWEPEAGKAATGGGGGASNGSAGSYGAAGGSGTLIITW